MSNKRPPSQSAESLVGDVMNRIADEEAHATAARRREAIRREERERRLRLAASVLVPLCGILTALNLFGFGWFDRRGEVALAPGEARTAAMLLLSDAADDLALFLQENGHYPEEPAFLGPDGPSGEDEPFRYELLGSHRFVLSVTIAGETVTFDSRDDPAVVFRDVRDATRRARYEGQDEH